MWPCLANNSQEDDESDDENDETSDEVQLPPIFNYRNRLNYKYERGVLNSTKMCHLLHQTPAVKTDLFSDFDNRYDHQKTKRFVHELSHRYNYESPQMMVSPIRLTPG